MMVVSDKPGINTILVICITAIAAVLLVLLVMLCVKIHGERVCSLFV